MENIRVILAAVAFGIGVLLFVIAFVRSLRKKAPATANWVFSGLFLVVAVVLWIRGSDPALSDFPAATAIVPEESAGRTEAPSEQLSESDRTGGTPAGNQESDSKTGTTQVRSNGVSETASSESKPSKKTEARLQSRQNLAQQPRLSKRLPQAEFGVSWEDKIFAAIDASFDWIEEFFDQYATPVAPIRKAAKQPEIAELPNIAFPEIRFNTATAELTSESQVELKILAAKLTAEYPKGILEIQAYVDSVGPEAFNFVLTQARADAIRDLLISEGMNASRIIAKGYGTGEDPELADSHIEFIVRR
ncbi:OmpA family protein [bacterium]|nr:OmpA family protein [bacterium]MBU1636318.1 OmpA family protein [bacterium]MBU1920016.1 OmpA family protein [bacterium]